MNFGDSQGAVILGFDAATPITESLQPIHHALVSEWNGANPTKITGVRNLTVREFIGPVKMKIVSVLETDQDS